MNKSQLHIVFMGTPEFAVLPLNRLIENGFTISAVVTAADKPAGRGQKIKKSPVKKRALEMNLPLLQPTNLKDPAFIDQLNAYTPDLIIVVAFRMLPEVVWKIPKIGTFNLHASLLPQYRGAAPINWVLINGEKETGVTTFFIDDKIDTGTVLFQKKVEIKEEDTAGTLHDRLMDTGAELVVHTCEMILAGTYKPTEQHQLAQSVQVLKPAPRIYKPDCKINWNQSAERVLEFIRGLSPYPGAYTHIETNRGTKKQLKVFNAHVSNRKGECGSMQQIGNHLYAFCDDEALILNDIQMEGKRRMNTDDFLRGQSFKGSVLFI